MSADDPLQALEDWVAPLLAKLSPAERRGLARRVGQDLRRAQASRIAAQQNPDGSDFEPRKSMKARQGGGRIRGKMFRKLRTAQYLRVQADAAGAAVGFLGRTARLARVHQYGLRDEVQPGGAQHRYAARELLGMSDADRDRIRESLLAHLT